MRKYTQMYFAACLIVLMLFTLSLTSVKSGSGSIRFMGVRINLAQGSTYQLYKINDSLAFEVNKDRVSLVSYEKTSGIYVFAGDYQHAPADAANSVFMVSADYQKGDYIYTEFPIARTSIINITSGEKVGPLVAVDAMSTVKVAELPEYRQRGLEVADQYRLTSEQILAKYPGLPTYNENVFIVQMAFGLILLLLLLGGIPILFSRAKTSA